MGHDIDGEFTALPLANLADAALSRAREVGAEHADFRVERIRTGDLALHDALLETSHEDDQRGIAVRVVHDGVWGFASGVAVTPDGAARLVDEAVAIAKASRGAVSERIELAPEPTYSEVTWLSAYDVDPFDIPLRDRISLLAEWSAQLLRADAVSHADATLRQVRETKYYADTSGTSTLQQRVRMQCQLTDQHLGLRNRVVELAKTAAYQ